MKEKASFIKYFILHTVWDAMPEKGKGKGRQKDEDEVGGGMEVHAQDASGKFVAGCLVTTWVTPNFQSVSSTRAAEENEGLHLFASIVHCCCCCCRIFARCKCYKLKAARAQTSSICTISLDEKSG
jgi:hypothetical protein